MRADAELPAGERPDVIITEVGGTVGDIESLPFLEAARQVRLMTGHDGPVEAMRAALTEDATTGPAAAAGGTGDV